MNELEDALERLEELGAYAATLRKQARAIDIDDDFDLLDYVNAIADQIDALAHGPRVASPPKRRNVVSTIAINVPH